LFSEINSHFEENCEVAAIYEYCYEQNLYKISLRSSGDDSPDVSVIASKYGGGGHPRASGFSWKSDLKSLFGH